MRKSFDGLSGLVRNELDRDPLSGDVFIFINRRRNQIRLLAWDTDGFALYSKRLERGTYELPTPPLTSMSGRPVPGAKSPASPSGGRASMQLSAQQLRLLMDGIVLQSVRTRKRYSRPTVSIS